MKPLLFDCEIEKLIPNKNEDPIDGIEYCNGWTDYFGMGISIISCFDYKTNLPRLFSKDNFEQFIMLLASADSIVGFNSERFDMNLLAAHGVIVPAEKHYDLYLEIKAAAGANHFAKGYNMENTCQVNLGYGKTSDPVMIPREWQRGNFGRCFDYALRDIMMLKGLMDMVLAGTPLLDPGQPSKRIFVRQVAERTADSLQSE